MGKRITYRHKTKEQFSKMLISSFVSARTVAMLQWGSWVELIKAQLHSSIPFHYDFLVAFLGCLPNCKVVFASPKIGLPRSSCSAHAINKTPF